MATKTIIEFTCDRCFSTTEESIHNRTGTRLTIAAPSDKRKAQSYDLCGDCTTQLRVHFLTAVDLSQIAKAQP